MFLLPTIADPPQRFYTQLPSHHLRPCLRPCLRLRSVQLSRSLSVSSRLPQSATPLPPPPSRTPSTLCMARYEFLRLPGAGAPQESSAAALLASARDQTSTAVCWATVAPAELPSLGGQLPGHEALSHPPCHFAVVVEQHSLPRHLSLASAQLSLATWSPRPNPHNQFRLRANAASFEIQHRQQSLNLLLPAASAA